MLGIDHSATLAKINSVAPAVEITTESDRLLKEKTDEFEAVIIKTLLDNSLKYENHLLPTEPGKEIYDSMYREALSDELSGSFGFSELLFNFLKENNA